MSRRWLGEYFRAIYACYRQADRKLKRVVLNEFCANTGYYRKSAIRQRVAPFSFLPRIIPSLVALQNSRRHNQAEG